MTAVLSYVRPLATFKLAGFRVGDEYLEADFGLYQAPPTTTVPPEETLPTTGVNSEGLVVLAVGLLMLGGLAVLATRKRRTND